MASELTDAAFDQFRSKFPAKPCNMDEVQDASELTPMTPEQGLRFWIDGPGAPTSDTPPQIDVAPTGKELWVVRTDDVVHSTETSAFAQTLVRKVLKHSNLTGGEPAHCGGELLFLKDDVIALNGASGRYGPQTEEEMSAIATAFRRSGYGVWSLGFDTEAGWPYRFGDTDPEWVAA
ncbi:hypothetical protein [Sphingosinicella terrae]|uniref:hypothetical protein n=1 Tax=Sphingosinicella terrae TaxID=2172047 RepID=UPI0013B4111A|nr:hypothetical protein [Sphingosinicella terrae]